ncbi:MAG: hypothetical protein QME79_01820 [Bacillota bacterium]|nr:hypothetical protein [Bacillota bacterium]
MSFDLTPDPAKSYSELEIHHRTPQVILVEEGRVLVPVAKEFGTDCVEFVPLSAGEAMVISPEVWHFGPTASGANSRIIVAFRQGTPKHDLEKRTLPTPVTLPQPS